MGGARFVVFIQYPRRAVESAEDQSAHCHAIVAAQLSATSRRGFALETQDVFRDLYGKATSNSTW